VATITTTLALAAALANSTVTMAVSAAASPAKAYQLGKWNGVDYHHLGVFFNNMLLIFCTCSSGKSQSGASQYHIVLKSLLTELAERKAEIEKLKERIEGLEVNNKYALKYIPY